MTPESGHRTDATMNALLSSLSRVRLIAVNTAGEAVRQRYFLVSGLLAAAVVALSSGLGAMDFGASELKFIADLGFGALFFFGSLLAVVLPVHLFFSEMENRTALTLLARPLRRWEFLAGKLLGVWALLAVLVAALVGVTFVMLWTRHAELAQAAMESGRPVPVFAPGGVALFALLQTVRLGVVAALTLFTCSYARSALFAYGAGLGWLVAGQTAWLAREWAGFSGGVSEVSALALRAVPDLQAFNLGDALIFPGKVAVTSAAGAALLYGLGWMVVLTALGASLFRSREL